MPDPEPGINQVVVRVRASGLCYTDISQADGVLGASFPFRPGHEIAGEVAAVGEGVTTLAVGDRVGVGMFQRACGRCSTCLAGHIFRCPQRIESSNATPGGHAEYFVTHAGGAMPLPEGLDFEQAAPLFCAGFTVWGGLRDAEPQPGDTIAVQGIGGLGHLGIQFSKANGFRTIAVTSTPDKVHVAREIGADDVVADGRQLRDAGGADVLLYTGTGYGPLEDLLRGLHIGARVALLGVSHEPLTIANPLLLFNRGVRLIPSSPHSWQHQYETVRQARDGRVRTLVETFPLADVATAVERVRAGDVRFRAVIVP